MLRRSIPGYAASLEAIGSLAARYVRPDTNCYDLGCSLGAATIAMRQGIREPGCRIIAVDSRRAMIERCRKSSPKTPRWRAHDRREVRLADIRDIAIENASMVVMNYTLQFLDRRRDRDEHAATYCDGMNDGGLSLLSEKVVDENAHMEDVARGPAPRTQASQRLQRTRDQPQARRAGERTHPGNRRTTSRATEAKPASRTPRFGCATSISSRSSRCDSNACCSTPIALATACTPSGFRTGADWQLQR